MMRPMSLAMPPRRPDGVALAVTGTGKSARINVSWTDNSITETSFLIQRTTNGTTWTTAGTVTSPLDQANTHGPRTFTDPTATATTPYLYRVVARNDVGYGGAYPGMTVQSVSASVGINTPTAPTNLAATLQTGPRVSLTWRDNATNETGFIIQRSNDGGTTFAKAGTAPARNSTGNVTWVDSTVTLGNTYQYRVVATNIAGDSTPSNTVTVPVLLPGTPVINTATAAPSGGAERVTLTWADVANETGYTIQWSSTADFATIAGTGTAAANATTYTTGNITRQLWYFRMRATNILGTSDWSTVATVTAAP